MDEGRNMILLFPSLVHLKTDEDRAKFKPRYVCEAATAAVRHVTSLTDAVLRCHMFYGQRVMDIPDGLPKWSGINEESDLIEDSPPELVKERERKRENERNEKFAKGENK